MYWHDREINQGTPVQGDGGDAEGGDEHRYRGHQGEDLAEQWLVSPRPETDNKEIQGWEERYLMTK